MFDRPNAARSEENEPATIVAAAPKVPSFSGANALVQRTLGEVQVAVMMAKQFPRNKMEAREKLENDCMREGLASVALYTYARGGTEITGPTIRFAEAAKGAWGNIQSGFRELTRSIGIDGVGMSEVEAFAWDTENNTRQSTTFIIRHWRDTKKGGYALKDERDIRELIANQAKRVERTCILNSIDGDIIESGLTQCNKTLNQKVTITPEKIKSMIAAFDEYGVSKDKLEARLQRRIDAINAAGMIALTKIYNSIKDGMSRPEDWFDFEEIEEGNPKATGNEAVKSSLKKKAKAAGADPETGEIKGGPKKEDKNAETTENSESVEESPDQAIPVIETVDDVKQAANVLLLALEATPKAVRGSMFVKMHGTSIVDALRAHGQGILIGKIKALGIALPENGA